MQVRSITFIILAVLISGCATKPPRMWYLNGKSQQQLDAVHSLCEQQSQNAVGDGEAENAGYTLGQGAGYQSSVLVSLGLLAIGLMSHKIDKAFVDCMNRSGFKEAPPKK